MHKQRLVFSDINVVGPQQECRQAQRRLRDVLDPVELGSGDGIAHSNHPFVGGVETPTIGGAGEGATPARSSDTLKIAAAMIVGFAYCWAGSAIINAILPVGGSSW